MAATVGIAFGVNSDITAEAAGAVIMDSTLEKVDGVLAYQQEDEKNCPAECCWRHGAFDSWDDYSSIWISFLR